MRILDFFDGFESNTEPTSDGFAASNVSVTPAGNLSSTNAQDALEELQGDIDTINNKVGANNGIASLDSGGKVPVSQLPMVALIDVYQVADIAARDALTVQEGDVAVVADIGGGVSQTYIYNGTTWVTVVTDAALAAHMADSSGAHAASAISNSPAGTIAATTVQAAINELDGDVQAAQADATQALSDAADAAADAATVASNLSTHMSDTTTHGTTGDIVGTSDTQILTNKDIDGGTASNSRRITLPKNTKANLDTLTRKQGTLVYASDEDKVYADDGSTLIEIGTGGGGGGGTIEYVSNSGMGNTDDTTSFVTSNNGSPIPTTTYTATRAKRVQFSTPVVATDRIKLQFKPNNSVDAWIDAGALYQDTGSATNVASPSASNSAFGACIFNIISSTELDVFFFQFQDNSGSNWQSSNTSRWRVVKESV